MTKPCLFCQIVAGEVEADVVVDNEDFVGFLDHRPLIKGHVLLVPRVHVVTLPDLPAGLRDGFLEAAQRLATALRDNLRRRKTAVRVGKAAKPSN